MLLSQLVLCPVRIKARLKRIAAQKNAGRALFRLSDFLACLMVIESRNKRFSRIGPRTGSCLQGAIPGRCRRAPFQLGALSPSASRTHGCAKTLS